MQLRVPRRQHPRILAQPPGAAPVVAHRDDRRETARIFFQSAQNLAHSRTAADGYHRRITGLDDVAGRILSDIFFNFHGLPATLLPCLFQYRAF